MAAIRKAHGFNAEGFNLEEGTDPVSQAEINAVLAEVGVSKAAASKPASGKDDMLSSILERGPAKLPAAPPRGAQPAAGLPSDSAAAWQASGMTIDARVLEFRSAAAAAKKAGDMAAAHHWQRQAKGLLQAVSHLLDTYPSPASLGGSRGAPVAKVSPEVAAAKDELEERVESEIELFKRRSQQHKEKGETTEALAALKRAKALKDQLDELRGLREDALSRSPMREVTPAGVSSGGQREYRGV